MNRNRIASLLAVILGLFSIAEGQSVLLGFRATQYATLPWLVWFNVIIGLLSVIAARGLWNKRTWANKLADTIVTLHGLVFLNLAVLFSFHQPVVLSSIIGMLARTLLWVSILMLTRWQRA